MVSSTRQSARLAEKGDNEPTVEQEQTSPKGTKRKADAASPTKGRGAKRAEPEKKQKTLEETVGGTSAPDDVDMIEAGKAVEGIEKKAESKGEEADQNGKQISDEKEAAKPEGGAVKEDTEREQKIPTSIVEKGVIYFFTRKRVGIEDAEGPEDLQRTYFVLRPVPKGTKLEAAPIEDSENNRLFALPKKVFPKSHSDRFMAFAEKGKITIKDLKETFFAGATHETKTQGTREVPPTTPIGEGVYAITDTGRSSHLAYMLTIPTEIGDVQKELGLRNQGSFVMSVKNPERKGPASAQLPQGPNFPKEIIEEFRGLAWVSAKPQYLSYDNVQILLIGEGTDDSFGHALDPKSKDQREGKEEPREELEKLEHEDELRVEHLHGNDTVFDDLKLSKNEFPQVPTTW
ncbi:Neurofilament medium polypeptide [Lasiodiplodia theobromae]|uniref:Neurofilament medium polypeptide n=1 Tax=Lasiodiplodia theobromae TaxID=45133 RepID=A0A5N5D9P8_9PEZI|nr:Neurofilament medium polypeptide [Lasiodiplodia theobromae]